MTNNNINKNFVTKGIKLFVSEYTKM